MSIDLATLATPGVRRLQPYQPGKPASEVQRELGLQQVIKLASNESPFGPSPLALARAREALTDLHRYPDGGGFALKRQLAAWHRTTPEHITLGNGSNDVLELIARVFASPEHEVVYAQHSFIVYALVTKAIGAGAVEVAANAYGHDLPALAAAISPRCRLVFIANPNNPTGTWNQRHALRRFLDAVPSQVIAVIDEAYCDYVTDPDYPDCQQWLAEYPNLIVTRTFSKAYGLAALRIGYALSSPLIADLLNRIRQPFNVNSVALEAALGALDDSAHIARVRALNAAGRQQLESGLAALGMEWLPSAGNFLCVRAFAGFSGQQLFAALLKRGIIVRTLDEYQLPQHVRITIGSEEENNSLLKSLSEAVTDAALRDA